MNKYQEAIHDLKMAVEYPKSKYNDSRLIDLCFENIQELVEKATPKKPEEKILIRKDNYRDGTNIPRYDWWCPNCHLEHMSTNIIKHCPTCGQALDWSNCDE